jgi:hypothetical protein
MHHSERQFAAFSTPNLSTNCCCFFFSVLSRSLLPVEMWLCNSEALIMSGFTRVRTLSYCCTPSFLKGGGWRIKLLQAAALTGSATAAEKQSEQQQAQ